MDAILSNDALKDVMIELLRERREEFIEILEEVLEDYFLGEAIKEGLETRDIQKEAILKILKS